MIDVGEIKKKILGFIEDNGPVLPISLVKHLDLEPVFVSAILAELTHEKRIKTTYLKVGSSCLYYLEGQERLLEESADKYLGGVEKDVFLLLRKQGVILDDKQTPAFRVALRNLRDFAFSFNYNNQIHWRYFLLNDEEVNSLLNKKKEVKQEVLIKEDEVSLNDKSIPEINEESNKKIKEDLVEKTKENTEEDSKKELVDDLTKKETHNNKKEKPDFLEEIKSFLENKEITLVEILEESRSEINAIISFNSIIGELYYRLVAKNKKNISDSDLLTSFQKANNEKYPLYFLINGKLTKKAKEVLEEYKNLIILDEFE